MTLKITSREVDGVTLLTLEGQIGLGEEVNSLRDKVKRLVADGKNKVVLDMGQVTQIDSAGLGALVGLHKSLTSQGSVLRLCSLRPNVRETLQITRLLPVFSVSASAEEAVRNFSQGASETA
jgi:anti-sigma B factor antagonist